MNPDEQFLFLKRLAKGIVALFGQNCEVVVHDLREGYENTIVAIENGHVTNRRIGDGSSEIVLKALYSDPENVEDMYGYAAHTRTGREVKSSSIFIRDDDGKVIGIFGINYDVSDVLLARSVLDHLINADVSSQANIVNITSNVNDLLDDLITESVQVVGKPVSLMTKEDKVKAIQYLNEKGAFLVKKAGDKVSKFFDISKYTLYNYMDSES